MKKLIIFLAFFPIYAYSSEQIVYKDSNTNVYGVDIHYRFVSEIEPSHNVLGRYYPDTDTIDIVCLDDKARMYGVIAHESTHFADDVFSKVPSIFNPDETFAYIVQGATEKIIKNMNCP